MHATTLGQLSQTLGGYVAPGQSFAPALNQVLEVIYGMAVWRDLTIEGTFDCSDGYFSVPDQADTVLFAVVDGQPHRVRSLWHDYNVLGTVDDQLVHFGIVDDGYRPTIKDIPADTDSSLFCNAAADAAYVANIDPNNGESIILKMSDGAQVYSQAYPSNELVLAQSVDHVLEVRYESLLNRYDLQYIDGDPDTTFATVGPGSGVARFRRYRVPNARPGSYVHVLCKRRFVPILDDNDTVYISNTAALKHGLLAVLAEDNADLERSETHWAKCRQILDEQLDQYRGPARPTLDLQFYGDSVKGVYNQY